MTKICDTKDCNNFAIYFHSGLKIYLCDTCADCLRSIKGNKFNRNLKPMMPYNWEQESKKQ